MKLNEKLYLKKKNDKSKPVNTKVNNTIIGKLLINLLNIVFEIAGIFYLSTFTKSIWL